MALSASVVAVLAIFACAAYASPSFQYVPTPAGYMLSHCIHTVPSGSFVRHHAATGELLVRVGGTSFDDPASVLVATIPKCDTANGTYPLIRNSRRLMNNNNGGVSSSSPAPLPMANSRHLNQFPSDYEGWLAYTAFNYKISFDAFLGDFSVPNIPEETPDVLYLFTGLQNVDWIPIVDPEVPGFDIIQPVLQYPGDNGDYWSVKSWYVTVDSGALATDELQVDPGDYIFGNMTRVGPTSWYIGSTRNNSTDPSQTVALTADHSRLASQPWAYNTLECYGCSGCGTYPQNSPCAFTNLQLIADGQVVTPDWRVNPKPSHNMQCKEKPVVNSPTNVVIDFGNE